MDYHSSPARTSQVPNPALVTAREQSSADPLKISSPRNIPLSDEQANRISSIMIEDEGGLAYPSVGALARTFESEEDKQKRLERLSGAITTILECVGEDPNREGLLKTPMRYAKALLHFTAGYSENIHAVVNEAVFQEKYDEMVVLKNIEIHSLCEHHMVPFIGKISIGYIPNGKVIGLSKLARIANLVSRRLQVQERITYQVARILNEILQPRGVGVQMEAAHMCMVMRGVEKTSATTITSTMLGEFRENPKTRAEFLSYLSCSK